MLKLLQRRLFTSTALALGLAATLSAWVPSVSAQTVAELKKKGELTIGMLVDFPPYGTMNASNQPDGYDADVARLLAKDLGLKLNLVPVTGPNRIPFLLTNKVDLLVASLAITPERAK
ncbi:MAG: transporter substrate-binding domain-containing protein, partial [Rhodoferax sp.]|nr:transporter substrate-binding domain-containing protein [Rhodoferax sp.]